MNMPFRLFLLIAAVLPFTEVQAQCPPNDLILTSQAAIDAFPQDYPGCAVLEGGLIIQEQDLGDITHLDSLYELTEVQGYFQITSNIALQDLSGLDNVTFIRFLDLLVNPNLTSLNGLNNLTTTESLNLYYNNALPNLSGLESLTSIEKSLGIQGNAVLSSLEGLENLSSLESLQISYNESLTTLEGLNGLNYLNIEELQLYGNEVLAICDIQPVCDYLQNGGNASVFDNAPNCVSQQAIEEACLSVAVEDLLPEAAIKLFPNPTTGSIQVEFPDKSDWTVTVRDARGTVQLPRQSLSSKWLDLADLPAGLYLLEFKHEKERVTKKVVLQ